MPCGATGSRAWDVGALRGMWASASGRNRWDGTSPSATPCGGFSTNFATRPSPACSIQPKPVSVRGGRTPSVTSAPGWAPRHADSRMITEVYAKAGGAMTMLEGLWNFPL